MDEIVFKNAIDQNMTWRETNNEDLTDKERFFLDTEKVHNNETS